MPPLGALAAATRCRARTSTVQAVSLATVLVVAVVAVATAHDPAGAVPAEAAPLPPSPRSQPAADEAAPAATAAASATPGTASDADEHFQRLIAAVDPVTADTLRKARAEALQKGAWARDEGGVSGEAHPDSVRGRMGTDSFVGAAAAVSPSLADDVNAPLSGESVDGVTAASASARDTFRAAAAAARAQPPRDSARNNRDLGDPTFPTRPSDGRIADDEGASAAVQEQFKRMMEHEARMPPAMARRPQHLPSLLDAEEARRLRQAAMAARLGPIASDSPAAEVPHDMPTPVSGARLAAMEDRGERANLEFHEPDFREPPQQVPPGMAGATLRTPRPDSARLAGVDRAKLAEERERLRARAQAVRDSAVNREMGDAAGSPPDFHELRARHHEMLRKHEETMARMREQHKGFMDEHDASMRKLAARNAEREGAAGSEL